MFWLIDSCQNNVSADQYRLTVSRAQVSTLWVRVIFWRYSLTSCYFSNDRRLKFIFLKCIWNKSCFMSRSFKMLISNWSRTRKKIQPAFTFTCREGNRFWLFSLSCLDHALRPILTFWLVKIWQVSSCAKIYAASGNLLTDSWSWQSFVREFCVIYSSCDVLNCLLLLGVQNEIQLLSRLFCNS